jgi:hypothetical protein
MPTTALTSATDGTSRPQLKHLERPGPLPSALAKGRRAHPMGSGNVANSSCSPSALNDGGPANPRRSADGEGQTHGSDPPWSRTSRPVAAPPWSMTQASALDRKLDRNLALCGRCVLHRVLRGSAVEFPRVRQPLPGPSVQGLPRPHPPPHTSSSSAVQTSHRRSIGVHKTDSAWSRRLQQRRRAPHSVHATGCAGCAPVPQRLKSKPRPCQCERSPPC